jgi:hypothetical protein
MRIALAADAPRCTTQPFDHDPGWEGYNNHILPQTIPTVTQDFGYSRTSIAAKSPGEVGGRIMRASEPAWYGIKIAPKTLDDKLLASGTFALTQGGKGGGGICFGWFNGAQLQGTGRPVNSLAMNLSAASDGGRLAIDLITSDNQTCGTFITRYDRYTTKEEKPEMRPTPIRNDGTRYHWKLDYDPAGNDNKGQIHFTIKSDSDKPGDFEGKVFTVDLPDGFKKHGTAFDHFGLLNITRPGGSMSVYFADLELDAQHLDLSADPHWEGSGNHTTYSAKEVAGCHDFGYSATNHAGGSAGEIGGVIWRSPYAFYADRIGPLSLEDRLEARGRFMVESGAPDSGFYFGWFNSSVKHVEDQEPLKGRNFVGVAIGGPTRVGHYFFPTCVTAQQSKGATPR